MGRQQPVGRASEEALPRRTRSRLPRAAVTAMDSLAGPGGPAGGSSCNPSECFGRLADSHLTRPGIEHVLDHLLPVSHDRTSGRPGAKGFFPTSEQFVAELRRSPPGAVMLAADAGATGATEGSARSGLLRRLVGIANLAGWFTDPGDARAAALRPDGTGWTPRQRDRAPAGLSVPDAAHPSRYPHRHPHHRLPAATPRGRRARAEGSRRSRVRRSAAAPSGRDGPVGRSVGRARRPRSVRAVGGSWTDGRRQEPTGPPDGRARAGIIGRRHRVRTSGGSRPRRPA